MQRAVADATVTCIEGIQRLGLVDTVGVNSKHAANRQPTVWLGVVVIGEDSLDIHINEGFAGESLTIGKAEIAAKRRVDVRRGGFFQHKFPTWSSRRRGRRAGT